jgi:hypothetical protein
MTSTLLFRMLCGGALSETENTMRRIVVRLLELSIAILVAYSCRANAQENCTAIVDENSRLACFQRLTTPPVSAKRAVRKRTKPTDQANSRNQTVPPASPTKPSAPKSANDQYQVAVSPPTDPLLKQAQQAVLSLLKNPAFIKFSNLRKMKDGVCGEVILGNDSQTSAPTLFAYASATSKAYVVDNTSLKDARSVIEVLDNYEKLCPLR